MMPHDAPSVEEGTLLEPLPAPPLPARWSDSIEQAHRDLDALALWPKGELRRPDLDEALALTLAELSRIRELAGSSRWMTPAPKRFLVADDSPDIRFIVTRLIRRAAPDAAIMAVKDGDEALDALSRSGDGEGVIVISDYDMGPGRTGIDLLSEIADRHPKARRVLLTGHLRERIPIGAHEPHAILHKENGLESLRNLLAAL